MPAELPPPADSRPAVLEAAQLELASDRVALSGLTRLLGGPLPTADQDDPVGIEEPGFEATRVYTALRPDVGGRSSRLRATAWRGRVHTLELTFPERCQAACAARLERAIDGWLGAPRVVEQGRARLLIRQVDTVRARLEVYPERPQLTRLLLICQPLRDRSVGRPTVLPDVGQKAQLDPAPPCRPVSP